MKQSNSEMVNFMPTAYSTHTQWTWWQVLINLNELKYVGNLFCQAQSAKICVYSIGFITLKVSFSLSISFSLASSISAYDFWACCQRTIPRIFCYYISDANRSFSISLIRLLTSSKEIEIISNNTADIKSGMDSLEIACCTCFCARFCILRS